MPDKTAELAGLITDAMNHTVSKKTREYDTTATVSRIETKEDGSKQTWVSIPGGVIETPVRAGVSLKPGDEVQVHVGGGRAFIQGNYTSPPTDDTRADQAYGVASNALDSAVIAKTAADSAVESAEIAKEAAETAKGVTDEIVAYADTAEKTVTEILNDGETAGRAAQSALAGLSTVESVVNVINWVTKPENVTTDTTVDSSKTYYIYNAGTGTLSIADPQEGDNPSALGWYEIDEAIANYVSKHLALTNEGLSLVSDNSNTRTLITNGYYLKTQDQAIDTSKTYYELVDGEYEVVQNPVVADIGSYYEQIRKGGVYLINNNKDVAYYGEETQIGDSQSFNLKVTSTELGFYQADRRVAYLNNNTLYITQSVVVNEMQVGERNSRPEWTWKYDKSDRSLYLKWIGV